MKSFSGAKVRCLKDHAKPSVRQNSDHFMLHVGPNGLDSGQSQELTAKSITDITITFRSENHDVTISNRIP